MEITFSEWGWRFYKSETLHCNSTQRKAVSVRSKDIWYMIISVPRWHFYVPTKSVFASKNQLGFTGKKQGKYAFKTTLTYCFPKKGTQTPMLYHHILSFTCLKRGSSETGTMPFPTLPLENVVASLLENQIIYLYIDWYIYIYMYNCV